MLRDFIAAFGVCLHVWGDWMVWTGHGWRLAKYGEPARRDCKYCHAHEERG
jgi:hypothetical protein